MTSLPTNVNEIRGDGLEHREYHAALHKLAATLEVHQSDYVVLSAIGVGMNDLSTVALYQGTRQHLKGTGGVAQGVVDEVTLLSGARLSVRFFSYIDGSLVAGTVDIAYAQLTITKVRDSTGAVISPQVNYSAKVNNPTSYTISNATTFDTWSADTADIAKFDDQNTDILTDGSYRLLIEFDFDPPSL